MVSKSGFIKYSSDGFEQDSGQAMKNDVVRALIELITNSDDAYAREKKTGKIEVIVRRSSTKGDPVSITVRDQASGLDPQAMEDKFVVLGGDKSGFAAGEDVRGLFSRGSKDTAWFGSTVFESVKDGVYSRIKLDRTGNWESESCDADADHRAQVGVTDHQNGLSATMYISRQDTRVPELRELVRRLASHVQLRQIVNTQKVTVSEFRDGKRGQTPTVVWENPTSGVLFDGDVTVAGYGCDAHVLIHRLEDRSDGPVNEYSMHGLEVRGRRAAYMNSMFGQTGTAVGLVHGVVTCSKIDDLIRTFSASGSNDELNPMRLVSRSRDGLEETHPFMQALSVAVLEKLKSILADLEPKVSESGSAKLRRDLNALGTLLAEKLKDDLDGDNHGVGGKLPTASNPIIVIPPLLKARVGTKRSLTVLVYEGSAAAQGIKAASSSGACQVIGVSDELVSHPSFAETLVGQVRLELLELGSATVVMSAVSDRSESGSGAVVVHDDDSEESEPLGLEWKNTSMSVTAGKTRSVRLRAPLSLAPNGELPAEISLTSSNILLVDERVVLTLVDKGWLEARVGVTGVTHSTELGVITAEAGGQSASGSIRTTVPNPIGGLSLETEIVDQHKGPMRGEILDTDAGLKLVMYARHRGLADRLGSLRPDGSFVRDTELDSLVVIAEVMASVAGDYVLMSKVARDPAMYRDIDNILYERTKLVDRYLKILLEGVRDTAND